MGKILSHNRHWRMCGRHYRSFLSTNSQCRRRATIGVRADRFRLFSHQDATQTNFSWDVPHERWAQIFRVAVGIMAELREDDAERARIIEAEELPPLQPGE